MPCILTTIITLTNIISQYYVHSIEENGEHEANKKANNTANIRPKKFQKLCEGLSDRFLSMAILGGGSELQSPPNQFLFFFMKKCASPT